MIGYEISHSSNPSSRCSHAVHRSAMIFLQMPVGKTIARLASSLRSAASLGKGSC